MHIMGYEFIGGWKNGRIHIYFLFDLPLLILVYYLLCLFLLLYREGNLFSYRGGSCGIVDWKAWHDIVYSQTQDSQSSFSLFAIAQLVATLSISSC